MYSKEQIEAAKNINLVELLISMNYPLKKITPREYCLKDHDSLRISPTGKWYWHSRQTGGRAIDFFVIVEDKTFKEAMEIILGHTGTYKPSLPDANNKSISFHLPEAFYNNDRAISYLTKIRGLDKNLIKSCINSGIIYESSRTHNVVFVGYDSKGKAAYASMRGTGEKKFAMDVSGSRKEYGFFYGNSSSELLHLFESPIDLLSYISLEEINGMKCNDAYLSLSGVSLKAFKQYISEHSITTVFVRTDSDEAGKNVLYKLNKEYKGTGIEIIGAFPNEKDYNDELLKFRRENECYGMY